MRLRWFSIVLALMLVGIVPAVSSASTSLGFTGNYEPQHWTATGPGITSITPPSGATTSATFSYDLEPSGFSAQAWTYAVTAADDGLVSFNWNYSGFHSFFLVTAGLNVFADGPAGRVMQALVAAGPRSCCDPPSAGFNYSGTASISVHSGYSFGIITSGSHFDGTEVLQGSVQLTNFKMVVDATPPTITPTVSGTLGNNGWYTSDVDVTWTVTDPDSDISSSAGCGPASVFADTSGVEITCAASSVGGTDSQSVTVTRDATAPGNIAFVGDISDGASYGFGGVPAAPACTASDALSGLANCVVSGYSSAVGSHILVATATDAAGNQAQRTIAYTVSSWTLLGFYQPVDMNGVYNTVKNGSTVPFKFEAFAGPTELTSTANLSMSARLITCTSGSPTDDIEVVATGGTSLRYDTTGGQFVYNWQTPKRAGTCYAVTATTSDGSYVTALFKLK